LDPAAATRERSRRVSLDGTPGRPAAARCGSDAGKPFAGPSVRLAWAITTTAISSGVLFLALLALNSRYPGVVTYEYWGAEAVTAIAFPVVGALIVSRHPHNALGWLFCLMGLSSGISGVSLEYATYALAVNPLPGAVTAAWLSTWTGTPGFVSLTLVPLLFPDGQPPSRRWRPLVWVAAAGIVAVTVSIALMPGPLDRHPAVDNPFGVEEAGSVFELLLVAGVPVLGGVLLAGIASLVVRYRRSRGVERQQIKWFPFAAAVIPLALTGNTLFPEYSWLIGGLGVACIPAAIGLAILKHNLYDIDLVINRTLVYAALTACVVGVYVLVVGYLGALFRSGSDLYVSLIAAGIVAVMFAPLRDRLQRAVNRLMYGERDDPYRVVSRLGERLKATDAPAAVLPTIVETVAEALKLPHAEIALKREDGGFETVAARGCPAGEPLILPLSYGTETIGRLALSPRSLNEPFEPADRRLLDDLARYAESAAYAVRLTEDLQHSRERLVTAREEERRRLRRDLHDGLGPQLATLTLKLDATRNLLSREPQAADALLAGLKTQVQAAISDIRRLVYDLRPPALDELGLVPAIREQATGYGPGGLTVTVEAPQSLPPLPAAVEVAAYRIVQEALTNVARHAGARSCRVEISVDSGLELEITDDGSGLPEGHRAGVGLASMRERAAELGGTCEVHSPAEGGTRVLARLPLEASGFRYQVSGKTKTGRQKPDDCERQVG
jgi:two-component system NarL family sensor kinase